MLQLVTDYQGFEVVDTYVEHLIDVPMLDDRLPTKRCKAFTEIEEVEVVVIFYRINEEEHINVGGVLGDGEVHDDGKMLGDGEVLGDVEVHVNGEVPSDVKVHANGEVVDNGDSEDLDYEGEKAA